MERSLAILLKDYQTLCPGTMPCCHGNKKTARASLFCLAFPDLFNTFLSVGVTFSNKWMVYSSQRCVCVCGGDDLKYNYLVLGI